MNNNNVFEVRSLLQNAQSVLIALSTANDEDIVAAGLGLYLTLSKMKKQVTIVSSEKVKVEVSHLFGIDKVTDQIGGGNNLVVSMPYKEGSIEKVSYHIDGNKFNLVIEPRGERLDFDPNQIEYNYGRGDYDAVVILGASNLSALGTIYNNHKNAFTQKPIINIDKSENNTKFGRINIVNNMPVSQSIAQLIKDLRLQIDEDIASNLYTGIMSTYGSATLNDLDPRSLDALSFLGRMNARNLHKKSSNTNEQNRDTIEMSNQIKQNGTIQEDQQKSSETSYTNQQQPNKTETPEEWLKPKIFTTQNQGGY